MAGLEIKVSMTDVEPMMSYVEDMHSVVAYLRSKPILNTLERMVIENHQRFVEQLEDSGDEFMEPYLQIVKAGDPS